MSKYSLIVKLIDECNKYKFPPSLMGLNLDVLKAEASYMNGQEKGLYINKVAPNRHELSYGSSSGIVLNYSLRKEVNLENIKIDKDQLKGEVQCYMIAYTKLCVIYIDSWCRLIFLDNQKDCELLKTLREYIDVEVAMHLKDALNEIDKGYKCFSDNRRIYLHLETSTPKATLNRSLEGVLNK